MIAALVLAEDAAAIVVEGVRHSDFQSAQVGEAFRTLVGALDDGRRLDSVTATDALTKSGALNGHSPAEFVATAVGATPSTSNTASYVAIVTKAARKRQLARLGNQLTERASDPTVDPNELVGFASSELLKLEGERTHESERIGDILEEAVNDINDETAAVRAATGLVDLDDLTGGLHDPGLTIIAGRPHMGKTAFATSILANICRKADPHRPAIFFSLEMTKKQVLLNLLADLGGLSLNAIQPGSNGIITEEQWGRVLQAGNRIKKMNLHVSDDITYSPHSLRARTLRILQEQKARHPSVIVIDYLQLMDTSAVASRSTNREREVAYLGQSAKRLSRELRCPVVALAQLNRGVEGRVNKRPRMSDLRESGSLEQDSDAILLLHRPGYYDESEGVDQTEGEIIVAKNRSGRSGSVRARFIGEYARWTDGHYAQGVTP